MGWVVNIKIQLLPSWQYAGTHRTGGRVSPRAGLDGCGKSCTPLGFNPWTIQYVASRYTD